ncbi:WD repeat-containing protein 25 [Spatholobus suberectus]|nr:WD repeat-containing protein 25 [Spatholobus suberectus]
MRDTVNPAGAFRPPHLAAAEFINLRWEGIERAQSRHGSSVQRLFECLRRRRRGGTTKTTESTLSSSNPPKQHLPLPSPPLFGLETQAPIPGRYISKRQRALMGPNPASIPDPVPVPSPFALAVFKRIEFLRQD